MAFPLSPEATNLSYLLPGQGILHPPVVDNDVLLFASGNARKGELCYVIADTVELFLGSKANFGIKIAHSGAWDEVLSQRVSRLIFDREQNGLWVAHNPEDTVKLSSPRGMAEFVELIGEKIANQQHVDLPEVA